MYKMKIYNILVTYDYKFSLCWPATFLYFRLRFWLFL